MRSDGNTYFIFFKPCRAKLSYQITIRLHEAITFCGTFCKNVAGELKYSLHLIKKIHFTEAFPKILNCLESFPEAVVQWFSVKEILLGISQYSQEIPCTGGVSFQ